MITLTRVLAKRLRAVIRRALSLSSHNFGPPLVLEAGPHGLSVRALTDQAAIEYRQAGEFPAEQIVAPWVLLSDCEGTAAAPVTIEAGPKGRLLCQWQEKQVPLMTRYDAEKLPKITFPARPTQVLENEAPFLATLDEAMGTTDVSGVRYALHCLELRGASGELAATDGHQLLLQSGGKFPWEENLLVHRTTVFGCKELASDQPVWIGRTDNWVSFATGPWTIHLAIFKDGKFPDVDSQFRRVKEATSRLELSPSDARFLVENLKHLPREEDDEQHAVTLDLNGAVAVRSKLPDQEQATELVLTNSRRSGAPLMVHIDRRFLARAVTLGLKEFCIYGPDQSLLAQNERRRYVWMPLNPDGAQPPTDHSVQVSSPPENEPAASPTSISGKPTAMPKKKRTSAADSSSGAAETPPQNGHSPPVEQTIPSQPVVSLPSPPAANGQPAGDEPAARTPVRRKLASQEHAPGPIEQALALRESLRGLLSQTNQLVSSLRRQKKQQRLMQATLASIKQLQTAS